MREAGGAWIGWSGDAGPAPGAFEADGLHLVGLGLSETEVRQFYEGFCNATLWPLYHDVIAPPQFHRRWWEAYVTVNRRFAQAAAEQAAPGATVWVHDYQLQLVPRMLREQRDDVRIGFFNHIPFPGYEIFAQLPWRRQVVEGLLGADLLGFQRRADATNFLRACRRAVGLTTKGSTVRVARAGGLAGDPGGRVPDLDRREGPGRDRPAGRRQETVRADLRGAGRAGPGAAGRRPIGLHQGHPAPAARLRRAGGRRAARAAAGADPGGQPEPGTGRGVPDASGRGRGDGGPDQRRARGGGLLPRALPAPVLPARGDGRAVPGRRR